MKKETLNLQGAYTALVTPFDAAGQVEWETLKRLIDLQAEAGIDGIVAVGTTGESPTVNLDEHRKIIETVVASCRGRMQVIAGTGANSTDEALELTRFALEAGADATLQVTPYYNKPSQEGLRRHFSAVADLGLPVMLYNVPGRSSREIAVETVAALSAHPNIVAVKEAGGSVDRVSAILDACDLTVLSGDDALALPMMVAGARGVVSVASNLIPAVVASLAHAALQGNWDEARELHRRYYRLFVEMFLDTNPVPIKAAMAMRGLIQERYRLPLCEMETTLREQLRATLVSHALVEPVG